MIIAVLIGLGLCFGSFVDALVWRLREQDQVKKSKSKHHNKDNLSIVSGRSMCGNCHHVLSAKDLIPVLSWVELRGRCRYCQSSISWVSPLVELLTAAVFVGLYLLWPGESWTRFEIVDFATWISLAVGFMALIIYDLKWMELPNRVVFTLQGIVVLNVLVQLAFGGGWDVLTSAVWGFLSVGGLFYALFQVSSGRWIGGGDVKLGFVLGIAVGGPVHGFLLLFVASVVGLFAAVPMLVLQKGSLKTRIPFGPFLILAAVIVKLFGAGLVAWYRRQLLL